MAGVKISAATLDTLIEGSEMIPVSDGGVAKRITVDLVKDYTIDQIEAIAAGTEVVSADKLYVLDATDSVMKPVPLDTIVAYATNILWNKTADAGMTDTDLIPVKEGATTEKTVTAALLATYIQTAIRAAVLNPATLDASGSTAGADYFIIGQSGVAKSITLTALNTAIYSGMAAYVADVTASTVAAGTDELYVLQSDVQKLMPLSQIKTYLTDGLVNGLADIGSGIADADTIIVDDGGAGTTKKSAVTRLTTYLLTKMTADTLAANTDITTNNATALLHGLCPKLSDTATEYLNGKGLWTVPSGAITGIDIDGATDIGSDLADADLIIVDDGASGINRKSAISRLWTYILAKIVAVTDVSTYGWVVDEDTLTSNLATKVPTQQSVKAYVDARIPQAVDGTLATGNNASVSPTKLVYNKTCSDSTGDDIITLNDGTVIGQILTIYLGTKAGSDNAVITPATAVSYTTITLDAVNEIATLQWQGATVGWAILYTNGTVA